MSDSVDSGGWGSFLPGFMQNNFGYGWDSAGWGMPGGAGGGGGFTPEQERWARQQGLMSMLSSMGGSLLGMAQGGMSPQQQAAIRAEGMQQLGRAGAAGFAAQQNALNNASEMQARAAQAAALKQRLNMQQRQLLMGEELSRQIMGGSPAPAAPAMPQAPAMPTAEGGFSPAGLATNTRLESGGNPNARNPNSSATGPNQFIDRTWLAFAQANPQHFPAGATPQQILAMRTDPALSAQATQWYANQNRPALERAGQSVNDATLGLAHQFGAQGATRILTADPNTPIEQVVSPEALRANSAQLAGRTAGQIVQSFQARYGGSVPQTTTVARTQALPPTVAAAQADDTPPAVPGGLSDAQRALLQRTPVVPPVAQAPAAAPPQPPRPAAPPAPPVQQPGAPVNARPSGNSIANMPDDLRRIAAQRAAMGDIEGASSVVTQWLTRTPPQVQTVQVNGRMRELRADGTLGRDYGPQQQEHPLLTMEELLAANVPQQSARMLSRLATRAEQDQAIRQLASRETKPGSEQEDTLRREFQALAPVTRYAQSLPLYQGINSIVDRLNTARRNGQTDQLAELDLVVAIANLFDPGSVVREGEVANVIRTQGLTGDVQRAVGYATSGQRLPEAVLRQVVASADDRMLAYRRAVEPYERAYRRTAERRGLDPENILLDLGDPVGERRAERPASPPADEVPRRTQRPANATDAEIAQRIRVLHPNDADARRRAATAAGINPRMVE
jgi:hypothetical protein